jgi:hypothetical protein
VVSAGRAGCEADERWGEAEVEGTPSSTGCRGHGSLFNNPLVFGLDVNFAYVFTIYKHN